MTNPTRLLDSAHNPNARALLRAGLDERPKPGALRNTAVALGVTASVALTAPATAMVAPSLAVVTAKWVAVGTLAGLALAGGANVLTTPGAAPSGTSSGVKAAPLAPRRATPEVPVAPAPVGMPEVVPQQAPAVADRQAVPASAVVVAPATVPSVAPVPAGALPERPGLADEVAAIDSARRALAAGNAQDALAQLERYYGRARTGTLDREAQLLRIDALVGAGQTSRAHQLAQQYLVSYPQDPHAARLRALVGDRLAPGQTRPE